jgi:CheY-like chemotaxis protein
LRALLLTENEATAEVLSESLAAFGLEVDHADGSEAALNKLLRAVDDERGHGLVVVDEDCRLTSVAAFLKRLADQPCLSRTRTLLLCSSPSPDNENKLLVDACVRKPVSQSQLLDAILTLMADGSRETIRFRQPAKKRATAGRRILIAEDNDINQIVTTKVLASVGYECDVAENGKAALDALAQADYDLILMDCQMPEMDGFEATRKYREREAATAVQDKPVPIIALTANAMGGDRERCLEAGMTDYLSKPIDPLKLIDLIEHYLEEAAK